MMFTIFLDKFVFVKKTSCWENKSREVFQSRLPDYHKICQSKQFPLLMNAVFCFMGIHCRSWEALSSSWSHINIKHSMSAATTTRAPKRHTALKPSILPHLSKLLERNWWNPNRLTNDLFRGCRTNHQSFSSLIIVVSFNIRFYG